MSGRPACFGVKWNSGRRESPHASSGEGAAKSDPDACVFRLSGTTRILAASGCFPSPRDFIGPARPGIVPTDEQDGPIGGRRGHHRVAIDDRDISIIGPVA